MIDSGPSGHLRRRSLGIGFLAYVVVGYDEFTSHVDCLSLPLPEGGPLEDLNDAAHRDEVLYIMLLH